MKKLCVLGLFFSVPAFSGDILNSASISEVRNTSGNKDIFEIIVKGGCGLCANKTIQFPRSAAGSKEIHDRAFSMALTAFTTGSKVRVHNYVNNDCRNASYITIRH